jgi:exonuclease III
MPDHDDDNDNGPEYVMYSTLPVIAKRVSQNKRMYGVITYVRADFATHIQLARGVDWDDEGRVLIIQLPSIAIINVYAVNGTDSPYIPRSTGQPSPTTPTRHHRKRQFNNLLLQECVSLTSRGLEICLVGDINISRHEIDSVPRLRPARDHVLARKEFNEIFLPQTGLVDAWREWHGERTGGYTWFNRWKEQGGDCARVDMILCSRRVFERAGEVEIEEWGGRESKSDHAIMWIRIDGFQMNSEMNSRDIKVDVSII